MGLGAWRKGERRRELEVTCQPPVASYQLPAASGQPPVASRVQNKLISNKNIHKWKT